jgi:uncharacterized protein (DUF2147 family)
MLMYVVFLAATMLTPMEEADALLGQWLTDEGEARIEIIKKDGQYEGCVVWLKTPVYPEGDPECGSPVRDRQNPDPDKRTQPIIGSTMLKGFEYAEKDKWKNGDIYNAKNGKTYNAKLTLKEKDHLTVRGFVGISLLGSSTVWTRYTETPEAAEKLPV